MKITQRITMVYLVGFILFAGFAALTVLSSTKIKTTTKQLAQQEIPGLIAASAYKTYLQYQTIGLYEYYATADYDSFEKKQLQIEANIESYFQEIKQLPQYSRIELKLDKLFKKKEDIAQKFTKIMRQPSVDWDGARSVLAEFSSTSEDINLEIDVLVSAVAQSVEEGAMQSNHQAKTLINAALILTAASLIIGIFAAFNSHNKITVPIKEVSGVLTGIANRKDLTYRVRQYSNDEVGDIAHAANKLLDEFQRLASALNSSTQELNRTAKDLIIASDEIPNGAQSTQHQMGNIKIIAGKLQGTAESLKAQFKLLNF